MAGVEQLTVPAARDDGAAGEEGDVVHDVEDERARGDDHGGATRPRGGEPSGDAGLGVRVDRAGRLDEHEDLGVGEQRPCQGDPLALTPGERATLLGDLPGEPARDGVEHVAGVRDVQRVLELGRRGGAAGIELVGEHAGEQVRRRLGDDDALADLGEGDVVQPRRAPPDGCAAGRGVRAVEPAQACRHPRALVRVGAHEREDLARPHDEAGRDVDDLGAGRRCGLRSCGIGSRHGDAEHRKDLAHADHRAGGDAHRLGRGPERLGEERGEAVERDELSGGELTRDREACADPHDRGEEHPGQERLQGVEQRLRLRHGDAGATHALGLRAVARAEDLLAADAAEDPQPGDGVGTQGRQTSGGLALRGLTALQRGDQECEDGDDERQSDDDEHAERDRGPHEDDRDAGVGRDPTDEPTRDREQLAGPQRVGRHRGDDLARREHVGHRVAGPRDVVPDQLGRRERAAEPVLDRESMTDHVARDLDQSGRSEQQAPHEEGRRDAARHAVVDHRPQRGRDRGTGELADHLDDDRPDQQRTLAARLPPQVGLW